MATGGHEPVPAMAEINIKTAIPAVYPSRVLSSQTIDRETITAEDMALDASLERSLAAPSAAEAFGHTFHDPDEPRVLTPTKEVSNSSHLSSQMADYKPAKNLQELDEQVSYAKEYDCDSVDADENFLKQLRRRDYADIAKDGYFVFKNVKVHLPGHFAKSKKRDSRTIYDKEYRD